MFVVNDKLIWLYKNNVLHLSNNIKQRITMETVVKKQTAFRLDEGLVGRLKEEAKKANRSLSNYVECILMDSVYTEPNKTTLEALKEAQKRNYTGRKRVDTSSVEAMIKSCEE